MKKYTRKEIRGYITLGLAEDITTYDFNAMNEFLKNHKIDTVGLSYGVNGMNAGLFQDINTGELFAVITRNSALFMAC